MKMNPLINRREFFDLERGKIVKLTICDVSPIIRKEFGKSFGGDYVWSLFVIDPKHNTEAAKKIMHDITKTVRLQLIGRDPKIFKLMLNLV